MNDFTKEELEFINAYIYEGGSTIRFDNHEVLQKKLQFMIDNYCEHDYRKTLDKSGMFFISMCHNCLNRKPWSLVDE